METNQQSTHLAAAPTSAHQRSSAPRFGETVRQGLGYAIAMLEIDARCAAQRRLAGAAEADPEDLLAAAKWLRYQRAKRMDVTGRAALAAEPERRTRSVTSGLHYAVAMLRIDATADPLDDDDAPCVPLVAADVLLAAAQWIAARLENADHETEH